MPSAATTLRSDRSLTCGWLCQAIGNEMEMTQINLSGILPSATIMVVSVTGSTTNGEPLPEDDLALTIEACDEILKLDGAYHPVPPSSLR